MGLLGVGSDELAGAAQKAARGAARRIRRQIGGGSKSELRRVLGDIGEQAADVGRNEVHARCRQGRPDLRSVGPRLGKVDGAGNAEAPVRIDQPRVFVGLTTTMVRAPSACKAATLVARVAANGFM